MDPDAALEELLTLCHAMLNSRNENCARVAELVLALHHWIQQGGFLPINWQGYGR